MDGKSSGHDHHRQQGTKWIDLSLQTQKQYNPAKSSSSGSNGHFTAAEDKVRPSSVQGPFSSMYGWSRRLGNCFAHQPKTHICPSLTPPKKAYTKDFARLAFGKHAGQLGGLERTGAFLFLSITFAAYIYIYTSHTHPPY